MLANDGYHRDHGHQADLADSTYTTSLREVPRRRMKRSRSTCEDAPVHYDEISFPQTLPTLSSRRRFV